MKIYSVTGHNPSGKGLWTHIFDPGSNVMIDGERMFVVSPIRDPYVLLEDGTMAAPRWQAVNQDDGD